MVTMTIEEQAKILLENFTEEEIFGLEIEYRGKILTIQDLKDILKKKNIEYIPFKYQKGDA